MSFTTRVILSQSLSGLVGTLVLACDGDSAKEVCQQRGVGISGNATGVSAKQKILFWV